MLSVAIPISVWNYILAISHKRAVKSIAVCLPGIDPMQKMTLGLLGEQWNEGHCDSLRSFVAAEFGDPHMEPGEKLTIVCF